MPCCGPLAPSLQPLEAAECLIVDERAMNAGIFRGSVEGGPALSTPTQSNQETGRTAAAISSSHMDERPVYVSQSTKSGSQHSPDHSPAVLYNEPAAQSDSSAPDLAQQHRKSEVKESDEFEELQGTEPQTQSDPPQPPSPSNFLPMRLNLELSELEDDTYDDLFPPEIAASAAGQLQTQEQAYGIETHGTFAAPSLALSQQQQGQVQADGQPMLRSRPASGASVQGEHCVQV